MNARVIAGKSPRSEPRGQGAASRAALVSERKRAACQEAADILKEAEEKAATRLAEAEAQAEALVLDKTRRAEALCAQKVASASRLADEIVSRAEGSLKMLAVQIARKIIGAELTIHSEAIVDIVKTVLSHARETHPVRLRVNPKDAGVLRDHLGRPIEPLRSQVMEVIADDAIEKGGCIVETKRGEIDGRIELQLANIAKVLETP